MKSFLHLASLSIVIIILSACSETLDPPATEGEKNMADMMGITVKELRNQTPEEHMQMMQEMMK